MQFVQLFIASVLPFGTIKVDIDYLSVCGMWHKCVPAIFFAVVCFGSLCLLQRPLVLCGVGDMEDIWPVKRSTTTVLPLQFIFGDRPNLVWLRKMGKNQMHVSVCW